MQDFLDLFYFTVENIFMEMKLKVYFLNLYKIVVYMVMFIKHLF